MINVFTDLLNGNGTTTKTGDGVDLERTVAWGTGFAFASMVTRAAWQSSGIAGSAVETWSWTHKGAHRAAIPLREPAVGLRELLPLDDGRTLMVRGQSDQWQITLLSGDRSAAEQHIGGLPARRLRLLPFPGLGALALAASLDDGERVTLWLVYDAAPYLVPQLVLPPGAELPWRPTWLDNTGRLLGCNQTHAGHVRPMVADLAAGTVTPLPGCTASGDHRLIHTSPLGHTLLLADQPDGTTALARTDPTHTQIQHLPALTTLHGTITPLAVDPTGYRLALRADHGATSQLLLYQADTDRVDPVVIPPGVLHPTARWSRHGLHLVHSAPTRPADIATVTFGPEPLWHPPAFDKAATGRKESAHTEWLTGPAGPIEAVIYGARDWRQAPQLLMALHGGPQTAWRLDFNPFFQRLAAAGIAVVAPNQRGSTGYSPTHRDAIRGHWGGPDLDDICYLAHTLETQRSPRGKPPLLLFGASYGAYLALRVVTRAPELWARCALVAPFASVAGLSGEAPAGVRGLLQTLEARDHPALPFPGPDNPTPCSAPRLLILHGSNDPIVPATQSHQIRASLLHKGRYRPEDIIHREVPGGHDLLSSSPGLQDDVVRFLRSG
ncbi:alpha/beta fold hydrolase [Streptomyces sp. NPDC005574]|uniref:alpha/beta hydrolase family protein n=1 Tax=Streptomyces sp. NPDC005574 TaxID=3156891 RepID=UPI0033B4FE9E